MSDILDTIIDIGIMILIAWTWYRKGVSDTKAKGGRP
jgi:hypothetical protein